MSLETLIGPQQVDDFLYWIGSNGFTIDNTEEKNAICLFDYDLYANCAKPTTTTKSNERVPLCSTGVFKHFSASYENVTFQ
jgi:hypothetical protein